MLRSPLAWPSRASTRRPTLRALGGSTQLHTFSSFLLTRSSLVHVLANPLALHWEHKVRLASPSGARLLPGVNLRNRHVATAGRIGSDTQATSSGTKNETRNTALVKQLRERTAVSFGLCKQALDASQWDVDEAVLYLREAGIARAAKASLREAHEGLVAVFPTSAGTGWRAVVLNCETDFVQRSPKFVGFLRALTEHFASLPSDDGKSPSNPPSAIICLKQSRPSAKLSALAQSDGLGEANTVEDLFAVLTSQFGEKIEVATVELLDATPSSCIGAYVHGEVEIGIGRVAAFVEVSFVASGDTMAEVALRKRLAAFAKLLAMQVVATKPRYISVETIPSAVVEQERAVVEEAVAKRISSSAKHPEIIANNLKKCLEEQCLLQQEFLMMKQVQQDILGDCTAESRTAVPTEHSQPSRSFTVGEAMQLVARASRCSLKVTRMKLLTVGSE